MLELFKKTAIAGVVALGAVGAAQAAGNTVNIGVQVPITGPQATYGKDMLNAVKLAKKEINHNGGINGKQIVLTVADSACDPQEAVNAASKLVSKNVDAVVGGYCSGATLPTLQVYGKSDTPFVITASNSTKLIDANPGSSFMINSTGAAQSVTATKFFKKQGVKTLAIVNRGDAYSANLASLTRARWEKKNGGKVPIYATVNRGQQDYSSLVSKITSQNPDAVFWTAYYSQGALLIRQLRQGGYQGLIAVGDGSNSPKLFQIAGRAANGVFGFSNPTAKFLPGAKKFITDYKNEFGHDPGPYAPLTYEGTQLIAWAINKAGTTNHQKVIKAIDSVDGKSWVAGPISFTPQHTLARSNFVTLRGKDGHWTLYK